jgi:hypothetical protein
MNRHQDVDKNPPLRAKIPSTTERHVSQGRQAAGIGTGDHQSTQQLATPSCDERSAESEADRALSVTIKGIWFATTTQGSHRPTHECRQFVWRFLTDQVTNSKVLDLFVVHVQGVQIRMHVLTRGQRSAACIGCYCERLSGASVDGFI